MASGGHTSASERLREFLGAGQLLALKGILVIIVIAVITVIIVIVISANIATIAIIAIIVYNSR